MSNYSEIATIELVKLIKEENVKIYIGRKSI